MPKMLLTAAIAFGTTALLLSSCAGDGIRLQPITSKSIANQGKDYYRTLGEGEHALRKVTDPRDMPNIEAACADVGELDAVLARSQNYLSKPSSKQFFPVSGISHDLMQTSIREVRGMLAAGLSGDALAAELRRRFDVYISVGCDNRGTVLYTGYYTPIFSASLTKTDRFKFPLHRLPANHVKNEATGETIGLKRADGSIDREYPAREQLHESGILNGLEMVWLEDAFEAYVVSVQGSAILRLSDGKEMEIGYAGTNGREYKSIGLELIKEGKLTKADLTLEGLRTYFRNNPSEFPRVTAKNERYIFFQSVSGGPFGSLNERVTAKRSIATDKTIFPRGGLCIAEATLPSATGGQVPVTTLVSDQDTGGAIRAPGRCDFYWGIGNDAEALAGVTKAEGRLFYLVLNDAEYARVKALPSPTVGR